MLIALVLAFYWFCRETDSRRCFALGAMLMLLPLSRIYFDVLYKFTYYLPHAVMGFAVPAAVWSYARRKGEGRRGRARLLLALGLLLSFAVGLNGMRLLLTLYGPMLLSALLMLWLDRDAPGDRGFPRRLRRGEPGGGLRLRRERFVPQQEIHVAGRDGHRFHRLLL